MPQLVLPKIECEASTQNYGRFAIGPMSRGYGLTVGLALRRVLLSSLNGAAITAVPRARIAPCCRKSAAVSSARHFPAAHTRVPIWKWICR